MVWLEGGVYADIDAVALRPLYRVIKTEDDAVSGVGHREHGPEQHILAYSRRHPIIGSYLRDAVDGVLAGIGGGCINVTGPSVLYRAAIMVLGLPLGYQFVAGMFQTTGGDRSLRILPGYYECPRLWPYCRVEINSFGTNAIFKYSGYERDLQNTGSVHWSKVDTGVKA